MSNNTVDTSKFRKQHTGKVDVPIQKPTENFITEGQKRKNEWEAACKRQNEYLENPKVLESVIPLNGGVIVPKDKIIGFTEGGIELANNQAKKQVLMENMMEFALKPHQVVAIDKSVAKSLGIEPLDHVIFKPISQPEGELNIGGVAFFIFQSYEISLVIKDMEEYNKQSFND